MKMHEARSLQNSMKADVLIKMQENGVLRALLGDIYEAGIVDAIEAKVKITGSGGSNKPGVPSKAVIADHLCKAMDRRLRQHGKEPDFVKAVRWLGEAWKNRSHVANTDLPKTATWTNLIDWLALHPK